MINSTNQPLVVSSTPTKIAKINNKEKRKKKKKRPPHKSKMITGYIIYASEIRKEVIKKFPDSDFGQISKLVGTEWKNLPQETKFLYEKRAREENVESKIRAQLAGYELEKLAAAAEEKAKEESQLNRSSTISPQLPTTCNGIITTNGLDSQSTNQTTTTNSNNNNYNQQQLISSGPTKAQSPMQPNMQLQPCNGNQQQSSNNNLAQQQPLQIIQQQQQRHIATTVHYCSNNNNCTPNQTPHQTYGRSQTPQNQYQRNNIVYRKPTTVRLRPKDAITQTDPIRWVQNVPKKPLRFSQKFIDYLNSNSSSIV